MLNPYVFYNGENINQTNSAQIVGYQPIYASNPTSSSIYDQMLVLI